MPLQFPQFEFKNEFDIINEKVEERVKQELRYADNIQAETQELLEVAPVSRTLPKRILSRPNEVN